MVAPVGLKPDIGPMGLILIGVIGGAIDLSMSGAEPLLVPWMRVPWKGKG